MCNVCNGFSDTDSAPDCPQCYADNREDQCPVCRFTLHGILDESGICDGCGHSAYGE